MLMGIVKETEFVKVDELELDKVQDGVQYAIPDDQSYCELKLITKNGNKFKIESLWEEGNGNYRNTEGRQNDGSMKIVTNVATLSRFDKIQGNDGVIKDLGTLVAIALELYFEQSARDNEVDGFEIVFEK